MAGPTVRQLPPIHPGLTITILGFVPPTANTFSVNLLCGGPNVGAHDATLHLNPRFNENTVVCNSFQNGGWGGEERGGLSIVRGQAFNCEITVQPGHYQININGHHYKDFRHRFPKERANFLTIQGDVIIHNIFFTGPGLMAVATKQHISGGLYPGRIIYLTATPQNSFSINLRTADGGGDNAFHFNPRFNDHVVVRNTMTNGGWGGEERHQGKFPFQIGKTFNMAILCEPHQFKVAVDNEHFIEFNHRIKNLAAIQWINFVGDVTVNHIYVQ